MDYLKTIGSLLGILAFFWKVYDTFSSYLYIDLSINCDKKISIKTCVTNQSVCKKKIIKAVLLIGPENECPVKTFNTLNSKFIKIKYTNEILNYRNNEPVCDGKERAIIPLTFYYSENVKIGDEKLSYTASLDIDKLTKNKAYSVRFFICDSGRLHRSTQELFIL